MNRIIRSVRKRVFERPDRFRYLVDGHLTSKISKSKNPKFIFLFLGYFEEDLKYNRFLLSVTLAHLTRHKLKESYLRGDIGFIKMVRERTKVKMIVAELHFKVWDSYSIEGESIADVYLELLRAKKCLEYALEDYFAIKFEKKSLEKIVEE